MRINLLFLAIALFLSACTVNQIRVSKDEFKKEERVVLDQNYYVIDYDAGLKNSLVKVKVERVSKKGIFYNPVINLTIDAEVGHTPDNQLFIKVDERIHELGFEQINAFNKYDKEASSSTTTKTNTTTRTEPVVTQNRTEKTKEKTPEEKTTTETETEIIVENNEHEYNYSTFHLKASLDDETVQDILLGKHMSIRFYMDNEPVTIKLSYEKLKKWKSFLSISE